jgi:futalosine hydrolase
MPIYPEICKMKLLLVAATEMEIAPAIESLTKSGFVQGGHEVGVLITGIGQVATTWALTNALHTTNAGLVIQAGIAGAFSTRMAPASVVCVQKDCFGDLGMEENGHFSTIFHNGFAHPDETPFTGGWLVNSSPGINGLAMEAVSAVTINKVTDSVVQRQQLVDQFNPGIETMEGAAFHYVCLKAGIPFIQLRAISNYVGERDKSKWQLQQAISNLNHTLLQLIEALDKEKWEK